MTSLALQREAIAAGVPANADGKTANKKSKEWRVWWAKRQLAKK
jgi:hypothetical protein